jgi:hypothetical protein
MSTATKSSLFQAVNKPLKGALSRLFSRPFQLVLGKRVLTFNHPGDFEFAMSGRVAVSLVKVVELLHRPVPSLRRETVFVRLVEHNLLRALERCRKEPESMAESLRDMGLRSFSTDYRWRAIFEALAAGGPELNEYRRVAVVKYLQYLGARRDALGIIHFHKTGKAMDEEIVIDAELNGETAGDGTAPPQNAEAELNGFQRLPRGRPVVVIVEPGQELTLALADHQARLVAAEQLVLIDAEGKQHALDARRQMVGRGLGNDITLEGESRSVSRRHLVIEPLEDHRVRLTDVSAQGTYIPDSVSAVRELAAAAA